MKRGRTVNNKVLNNNYTEIQVESLVELCISKDSCAKNELIRRCKQFIKRTISLSSFNAIDDDSKEDLTQEVLIKILTKLEFYNFDDSNFFNWVYILTQHSYLDIVRKKKDEI